MYHYSNTKIDKIDFSKCENGFWCTSIAPDQIDEFGDEIGVGSFKHCLVIDINEDSDFSFVDQSTAKETIAEDGAKYGIIKYSGGSLEFTDAVLFEESAIKSFSTLS